MGPVRPRGVWSREVVPVLGPELKLLEPLLSPSLFPHPLLFA